MGQSLWRALDWVGNIDTHVSVPMYCEECMIFALASKSLQVLLLLLLLLLLLSRFSRVRLCATP